MDDQQHMIDILRLKYQSTEDRLIRLEAYSMKDNLIISGLAETNGESTGDLVNALIDLFTTDLGLKLTAMYIKVCHRLASTSSKKGIRDVIVSFTTPIVKSTVLRASSLLKGRASPIYINEQLPKEVERQRRALYPVLKMAKGVNKKCFLKQDRLIVNGKSYHIYNVHDAPIDVSSISTRQTSTHVLFSGMLSMFSNFFTRERLLHDEDDMWFVSIEQFFQYKKAIHCGNKAATMNIIYQMDPVTIKLIGDRVKITDSWKAIARDVMFSAATAKFSQNPILTDYMLSTGERSFTECNPYERYWSIGRSLKDAVACEPDQLISAAPGKNVMGEILDQVRASIRTKLP